MLRQSPPSTKTSAKILIIRFSAFGDVVQTLSVPSALQNALPGARVHWITRKDMAPLLKNHPAIDRVWEFDRKLGPLALFKLSWNLRAEGFTHIYDAHNNLRSRIISTTLRPWGIFGLGASFIRRSIRRWKRLLLFRFRINTFEMPFSGQRDLLEPLLPWGVSKVPPPTPQLFLDTESSEKANALIGKFAGAIALAPSAAYELKRWPAEYWKELIQKMPECRFILLGGPEDQFLQEIQAIAPERILNLAGKSSLLESAAVVNAAALLVSNDTGLLHVAEQLGKKAIALMGPAPFGFPCREQTLILERTLPCRPCSKHGQGPCVNKAYFHECLRDIKPDEVRDAIHRHLETRR